MTPHIAKLVFIVAILAWGAIRFPYQVRKVPVARADRGWPEKLRMSAAALGIGLIPVGYAVSGFPRGADFAFRPLLAWIGAAVFALSLALFYSAHRDLGRNFSNSLVVRQGHTLVTSGIYAHIRHPMYAGFWLWAAAQALLLQNWFVGLAGFVGFGILFFGRIEQEEKLMRETFGEDYERFARRTSRLVPWIY